MLAMLPLMSWIAWEYPQLARAPHTSPHQRRPAEPAYELPHPRPGAPTARTPAIGNPHPTPCSQAQRHNNGRIHGPTQNTPPISDAGRSTRGHQGAGTQRRRRRPPTRGRGHGLRPERKSRSPPRAAHPRNMRRRRAACPPSAPPGNRATAPAKAGVQGSTPSPAPMTERCSRWDTRPHAPPCATGWRRAGSWMRPHAAA